MDINQDCNWDPVPNLLMNPQESAGQHSHQYLCNPQELLVGGQPTAGTPHSSGASPPLVSPSSSAGGGNAGGAISPNGSATHGGGSSCCENGRPIMTDPVSGQTVCSCQYDSARLALSSYPRLSTTGVGVYGSPYPSTEQNPYPSIGMDSSAFYSPLSNPYGLKDSGSSADMSAWTSAGLQTTPGYYPYDPTLAAYGYGAGYDLAARRKNATRESTATLKAWLNEHKKNPYPTKGEKIMLAIITKMTLTQVSTWFANARRRLKKENKMTWEPKNKTDDDDDTLVSDSDDKEKDDLSSYDDGDRGKERLRDDKDGLHVKMESRHDKECDEDDDMDDDDQKRDIMSHHLHTHHSLHHSMHHPHMLGLKDEMKSDCGIPVPATKPKIWSLADTAACKTPPPQSQQPWQNCSGFALPSSNNNPYSRYSGFLNPYNSTNSSSNHSGNYTNPAGFPEVQTDTPPQTPPNMKLPTIVTSQQQPQQAAAGAPLGPMAPTAASTNGGYPPQQQGYNSQFSNRAVGQLSPRGEQQQQDFPAQAPLMRGGQQNQQHHLHQMNLNEGTAFKPFFKGSPPMSNGFVSPV